MSKAVLIIVRFHDGRYHGSGDWPPSPARLFQALVAGTARARLTDTEQDALRWLEKLDAPVIAAPVEKRGQSYDNFVPNNDLDAVGGTPRRVGEIRTRKAIRPRLFDAAAPFLYAWSFESDAESEAHANAVARIAEQLYQLGRGVDMAWAVGEVSDLTELDRRLDAYAGAIYRPYTRGEGSTLDCPEQGSLDSVLARYAASGARFTRVAAGEQVTLLFSQAARPHFRSVVYNSPPSHLLYDLRDTTKSGAPFAPWPLTRVAELVQLLRGRVGGDGVPASGVAKRLWDALPDKYGEIAAVLIGRYATEADKRRRVRILPLPSIGHVHVSRDIRRVLLEVPPNCPLRVEDLAWAFSGVEFMPPTVNQSTGEILRRVQLVPGDDRSMLDHYGSKPKKGH